MPTYEYECKDCAHTFEIFQSMSEPPLKECPRCGKEVRRLINGGSGIIFKGSGFYVTDKKGGGNTGGGKAPAKPAPESGKSAGSDKPAAASGGEAPKSSGESAPAAPEKKAAG